MKTNLVNLVKKTSKDTIWHTMNMLLLSVGARPGFYDVDDETGGGGFNRLSEVYRKEFVRICEDLNLSIIFEKKLDKYRYFMVINLLHPDLPNNWCKSLHSPGIMGKILGYPCSASSMDAPDSERYSVNVMVHTEFGKVYPMDFVCRKGWFGDNEKSILKWCRQFSFYLEQIRPYFKVFKYQFEKNMWDAKTRELKTSVIVLKD